MAQGVENGERKEGPSAWRQEDHRQNTTASLREHSIRPNHQNAFVSSNTVEAAAEATASTPTGFQNWLSRMSSLWSPGSSDPAAVARENCLRWKAESLSTDPTVVFLQKQLHYIGTKVYDSHIHCMPCQDDQRAGGYNQHTGHIGLCQDRLVSQRHVNFTLAHELIHLFDDSFYNVDWTNLRHHACSEIRASSLSGDCHFINEYAKGTLKRWQKGHQDCVRRRAILSVMNNESLKKKGLDEAERRAKAAQTVDHVFDACFRDTRPFDEIY